MIGKLDVVVIDAADIVRLSGFYQGLAGWMESDRDPGRITLEAPGGWRIGLQEAPDHRPPRWPGQDRPQQAHLDFWMSDLDAGLARALDLGGTLLHRAEGLCTVADPARPQQDHLDVLVDDLDAGEQAALALGATRLAAGTETFRVFADPAGKPFCPTFGET